MSVESAAAREVIANFAQWSADGRFSALRSLVPEDGDGSLLAPFLLAVAADVSEDDLVRIEAVRIFEILRIDDDSLAERCRGALIRLARTDDDWDVRNAAGCAVFDLPGAEREVETMRSVIAAEQEDFVRENVGAALEMFLRRRDFRSSKPAWQ
ncbi:HEAT repeat domain-containing protein [Rhodococcus sp. UNC363MFTsu5.1]|uniref:HEAT repeat domain-containing protein n=1 Tax=Rhodococcus sp. UNC363MFTsu5.1 TaxID=1449069 RepID=UPI0012DD3DB8|nr:HEAT repeat domain-containing protein [Rhodococcus sp. UNC363MFTsu5.1]